MKNQRTLQHSFSLQGKGLHSGLEVNITFHPAPDNHGYKIMRKDIASYPVIDALTENVSGTTRGITLTSGKVSVEGVEHALAALYACEIDNCLVEVDADEFPVLDGSSIQYVSKIKQIGVKDQASFRKYIDIRKKKIRVSDSSAGSSLSLVPGEGLKVQATVEYDSFLLKKQQARLENLKDFAREIAPARTFVFAKDLEHLFGCNLIQGGSLDNAIVIYDTTLPQEKYDYFAGKLNMKYRNAKQIGYLMNRPLSYPNEPARHKLLDIIGDLALTGGFLRGTVVANRPGHSINIAFAKAVREQYLAEKQKEIKKQYKHKDKIDTEDIVLVSGHHGFYWNCP